MAYVFAQLNMPSVIQEALQSLLAEGLMPGVSLWGASFSPFDKTTEFVAFRLHGWEGTQIQIGASDVIAFKTTVPAWQYEEDGVTYDEPETVQDHTFRFLTIEPLDSRDLSIAATHEIALGTVEGIDLLYASYEIPFSTGTEARRVVAGLRVRMAEGYFGKHEASFAIIQKRPDDRIRIGPASHIISDLPPHFEPVSP